MIPAYAVSLPNHTKRRQYIVDECLRNGIVVEIVDAEDMRQASEADIRLQSDLPLSKPLKKQRYLKSGELGCALSHRKIYRTMLERKQDYALILEDDAQFIAQVEVLLDEKSLSRLQEQYSFDVLIIGYVKTLPQQLAYYYRRIPLKYRAGLSDGQNHFRFGTPWEQYGCGTVAYIISARGAAKLMEMEKPCVPADDWLYFEQQYGLRVLHCRPAVVLENLAEFDSTIRQERDGFLQPKRSSVIIRSIKGCLKNIAMNYLGF